MYKIFRERFSDASDFTFTSISKSKNNSFFLYQIIKSFFLNLYFLILSFNILVPYPPKDEQVQIVEYIENQTAKIDKAIELQQNYISRLKEYKASLIDSVVTGKVRVA
jgi:restriction endonuclease S subunit